MIEPYMDVYTSYSAGVREGRRQANAVLLAACERLVALHPAIEAGAAPDEAVEAVGALTAGRAAIAKAKGARRKEADMGYRQPDGTVTENPQKYIEAWRALAAPIERMLPATLYGFDPDLALVRRDGTTLEVPCDLAGLVLRLSAASEAALAAAIAKAKGD